ncbi:TadE family type IV pilus minor pilin [Nocardioides marmorisolisilvae]|nr:TadE family type IV pilus minor pilin [Nocardioides marmorisolisilvae]
MRRRDESGAVTAETATVIPVLVVLAAVLAWMVAFGVAQARVVDAARETARALARGDDAETSSRLGRQIAPDGAQIVVREEQGALVVTVTAEMRGPGGLLGFLGRPVRAEAVAAQEPGS